MDEVSQFLRIIAQERARTNESERAFSLRVSGTPDMIRKARDNHALPRSQRLGQIADALHLTVDQLLGRSGVPGGDEPPRVIEIAPAPGVGDVGRTFRRAPQDLPVRGTALGHNIKFEENGAAAIEVTIFQPGEVLHYVARPPALTGNPDAYAIYVQGDSMYPAHKEGALRVVNPRVGVRVTDDVVVQLRGEDGDDGEAIVSVLIKTLVKRSASFVELEQLNPHMRFRVPVERIAAIHRVMDLADLLG
jgi:hypothetical protein